MNHQSQFPETYWLAFRVPPQKERIAETIAKQCGFNAVVPTEIKTRGRRVRKSKKEVKYPIVNGYLFMRFDGPCDWLGLSRISIIRSAVGFDGRLSIIEDPQMQRLLKRSGKQLPHLHSANTRRSFAIGETVEITNGPLINNLVKVEDVVGEKARIVFKMLGVERSVEVPLGVLDAA